jgi:hypothetical protein
MTYIDKELLFFGIKKQKDYWVCYWNDEKGKSRFKLFNINIFGDEQAKLMSVMYRQKMITEVMEKT